MTNLYQNRMSSHGLYLRRISTNAPAHRSLRFRRKTRLEFDLQDQRIGRQLLHLQLDSTNLKERLGKWRKVSIKSYPFIEIHHVSDRFIYHLKASERSKALHLHRVTIGLARCFLLSSAPRHSHFRHLLNEKLLRLIAMEVASVT